MYEQEILSACENKNAELIADYLRQDGLMDLDKGIDLCIQDGQGKTPLHYSVIHYASDKEGYLKAIRLLLDRNSSHLLSVKDNNGRTALFDAVLNGHLEVVKFLVEQGADIKVRDRQRRTALHHAASADHIAVVKFLAEQRAGINMKDTQRLTALHHAARAGHIEVVKFLVEKTADINIKDMESRTALYHAASGGHVEVVKFLVEQRAGINIKDTQCRTALHRAASAGHKEVVTFLLERGADINLQNNQGQTALQCASSRDYIDVVNILSGVGVQDKPGQEEEGHDIELNIPLDAWDGNGEFCLPILTPFPTTPSPSFFDPANDINFLASGNLTYENVVPLSGKQPDIEEEILRACENKNAELIANYLRQDGLMDLDKGIDLCIQDEQGKTPLHYAVIHYASDKEGYLKAIRLLLDRNSSHLLSAKDNNGRTALFDAVFKGHLEVVQFLLEKSSQSRVWEDRQEAIPLHCAALKGYLSIVQELTKEKAEEQVYKKNIAGITPLHCAVNAGHIEVVKFFVGKGALINVKDNEERTVLQHAASGGHVEVVKFLVEQEANINVRDRQRRTALHHAASAGHIEVVKFLVEQRAGINIKDTQCRTALHHAASAGHKEVVTFLLERGADINVKNKKGQTALQCASIYGYTAVVNILAGVGVQDKQGQEKEGHDIELNIPLHAGGGLASGNLTCEHVVPLSGKQPDIEEEILRACENKNAELIADYLRQDGLSNLDKGIDLGIQDEQGKTPLHYAVIHYASDKEDYLKAIRLLLDRNSSHLLSVKDNKGWTVLFYAVLKGHLEIVQFLLEKSSQSRVWEDGRKAIPLHCAALKGYLSIVQELTKEKAKEQVSKRNIAGITPLHCAANAGHIEVVKFLVEEKGALINAKDKQGRTVLQHAASNGHIEVVKLLVEQGADIKLQDKQCRTALHHAASAGYIEVVTFLVERGADINVQNKKGQTALQCASSRDYTAVVNILAGVGVQDKQGQEKEGHDIELNIPLDAGGGNEGFCLPVLAPFPTTPSTSFFDSANNITFFASANLTCEKVGPSSGKQPDIALAPVTPLLPANSTFITQENLSMGDAQTQRGGDKRARENAEAAEPPHKQARRGSPFS